MKFKVDEISSVIKQEISQYRSELHVADVGKVLDVGDGIARIYGLRNAMAGEMLEFENGAIGQVFNLETNSIGAVILGDYLALKERRHGAVNGPVVVVPVGRSDGRPRGRSVGPPLDVADPSNRPPPPARIGRAGHRRTAARDRAAADRHQADRQHDSDRPRPARTHHRRSQDRKTAIGVDTIINSAARA